MFSDAPTGVRQAALGRGRRVPEMPAGGAIGVNNECNVNIWQLVKTRYSGARSLHDRPRRSPLDSRRHTRRRPHGQHGAEWPEDRGCPGTHEAS